MRFVVLDSEESADLQERVQLSTDTSHQQAGPGTPEWRERAFSDKFPDHLVTPTFEPLAAPEKMWGLKISSREYLEANERRAIEDVFRIFLTMKSAPPCLWGPPGARKTRFIESLARETDENGVAYQVISLQPSTEDPTIIHGIKYTTLDSESGETVMRSSIPDVAMQIINYWLDHHGLTILFMDEMTTCMPAQQSALLGVLTHGRYGGQDVSDFTTIAMAANPENTVSTVHPLTEAVMNRGAHLPWYGDTGLFLEEWRTGFKGAVPEPSTEQNWLMTAMISENGPKVFRSDPKTGLGWTPESLVPYDMFSNSERSMTEWSRAMDLIESSFRGSDKETLNFYMKLGTRAILGPTWADSLMIVLAKRERLLSADSLIRQVKNVGVERDWDLTHLRNALEGFLDQGQNNSALQVDQIHYMCIEMVETIRREASTGRLAETELLTMWSIMQLAPRDDAGALHLHILSAMMIVLRLIDAGAIDKSTAKIPKFVDEEIRDMVQPALVRLVSVVSAMKRQ